MKTGRSGAWFGIQAVVILVASCGSPPQYVARDGGAPDGGAGQTGVGGAAINPAGGQSGTGGSPAGGGGTGFSGSGGNIAGAGGVIGHGGTATGGTSIGTGGTAAGGMPAQGGSGVSASGGASSGGAVGSGGAGTGTGGAGGGNGCTGTMKVCNGTCVPNTTCCGGCSGNTPVCNNGTCTAKSAGVMCTIDTECSTGHCADGVCCSGACTGQCESCIAATKGTCTPVTTPRTPCNGNGTCAGHCDGTAANTKACVYPPNTTSCGVAASCTGSALTSAALCDGNGICDPSMNMTCMFGCRTDGMVGCAGSCPTGEALCGGATCVDITATDAHCGTSCTMCSGTTPRCSGSACVQCLSGSDCPAEGSTCTTSHTCQCRQPSAGNLLKNPGFDQGLANWSVTGGNSATASTEDADDCTGSGSFELSFQSPFFGMTNQCVPVQPNTLYYFSFLYTQTDAGAMYCMLTYYTGSTCSTSLTNTSVSDNFGPEPFFTRATTSLTSPATAGSAQVYCQTQAGSPVFYDQFYLGTSSTQLY